MKTELEKLYADRDAIESQMPQTFTQQRNKNAALFEVCHQIEKLEDPISYEQNKNHWDGHEIRF